MKRITCLLMMATALAGCEKSAPRPQQPAVPPPPAQTPTTSPAPTPTPTPAPAANLAPKGALYITQRILLETENSLLLLADIGTRVEIVSREGSKLKVRSADREFEVDETSTTNNLDELVAILAKQGQRQQAIAAAAERAVLPVANAKPTQVDE